MKKIIKTSANLLTVLRIILVFFMLPSIFFLRSKVPEISNTFIIIFFIASITDVLDGYIAKKITKKTVFGKFFDPIADKLLIIISLLYIFLLCDKHILIPENTNHFNKRLKNLVLGVLIVAIIRDFLIMGVRLMAFEKNKIIAASFLGKIKTIFTFISVLLALLARYIIEKTHIDSELLFYILICLFIIDIILIIFSGIHYIIKNFKLIQNNFY
ncbi:CDP-alcohol phosphatidyltransferase family protein ['Camptotheca acuminata' phytoplasma]|uniref:CDP-alcohol phosphatidyltransferase family protein n=1 Tax='Camptotheca acuminata' phytoplasma TaxID=3239192 RepID=UPI003519DB7C